MKTKNTDIIYFMSYNRHRIFYDKSTKAYMVAIKRDGTDNFYLSLDDAMNAIDKEDHSK